MIVQPVSMPFMSQRCSAGTIKVMKNDHGLQARGSYFRQIWPPVSRDSVQKFHT